MSFVILVEPFRFYGNAVTAVDNKCQKLNVVTGLDEEAVQTLEITESEAALQEHRAVAAKMHTAFGIHVSVVCWAKEALLTDFQKNIPDSIFPNNSFSMHVFEHRRPTVILYPMSPGRRDEIPISLLNRFLAAAGKSIDVHDLRHYQSAGKFLEGTGAINFSHDAKFAYMSRSLRTNDEVFANVCEILCIPVECRFVFTSVSEGGDPVYHTNVVGWVGKGICAWTFDSMQFSSEAEEQQFHAHLNAQYKVVVSLTLGEMAHFSGNALEVVSASQKRILCMSATSYSGVRSETRGALDKWYGTDGIASFDIKTIERLGGGSVRCLLASVVAHGENATVQEFCKIVGFE